MTNMIINSSLREKWRSALAPGCTEENFAFELYNELSEYIGKPIEEIQRLGRNSQQSLNEAWKDEYYEDSTPFYRKNEIYLFNLIHWHANYGEAESRVKVTQYLKENDKINVLDFGSGIGSTAILFASNGLNVSVADIAENLLSFLEFRLKRHRLKYRAYNLNTEKLPHQKFQAITAIDVLEHINDPKKIIGEIYDSLVLEGLFCFNVCGPGGAPMHVSEAEHVLCHMSGLGFVRLNNHGVPLFIYKKVPNGSLKQHTKGFFSYIYYMVRLKLRHLFEYLGIYRTIKNIIKH